MSDRVLVADDDRAVREAVARALELDGYDVVTADNGVETLVLARRGSFGALVLDVMMPHIDGVAVCRVLRADGDRTPVLMLTARAGVPDRANGLDAGADDYLPKPFEVPELLARLRALLRRAALTAAPASPVSAAGQGAEAGKGGGTGNGAAAGKGGRIGNGAEGEDGERPGRLLRMASLRVSPGTRRAWWATSELRLTRTEFDLLELLVHNEGLVLDHAVIYRSVWGPDADVDTKNLAGYIGYLRRKLTEAGAPDLIRTVRGVGYAARRP
ncbi:response regulator transcription factor [Streptomyces phaeoluteigriseus]|uniref:Response regulator transcription factor n=1 Tax=Streptomyces phaeoluteigriseus TaxID=114686 RepID=A0ABY4Z0H0_9ACTN|nr:response regulator transcription factor [Streptomyces phaeoluteigriseus]USQ82465.1 response regulator transcription factor [Streptomyces phaeoluteigriseus]